MPTRRSHGEGTIKHRSDGRWEARLTLPNGKRRSFYGRTRKSVQDKLRRAQRDLGLGIDLTKQHVSVGTFLEEWLAEVEHSVRPSTYASYRSYTQNHLIPGLGAIKLHDLNAAHINRLLREKEAAGLASRTCAYMRAILRKALNEAINLDLVQANAASRSRAPVQQTKQVIPLTADQVRHFLTFTRDDWYGPLFHVAIGTGLRQGELLGLRREDVDLDNAVLRVRFALQRINGKPTFVEPKTQRSRRTLALDPLTVDALRRQEDRQLEARRAAGERWQEWNLVFTSTVGTPLNPSNVTHALQRLLEKAGLPRQRFHDLRHCAASLLLAEGADLRTIMDVLGHSQISLTANLYTHLSEELRRDAAERMGAALSGNGTKVLGSD
jgi:integrase